MVEYEYLANQTNDEYYNLDIFEMIINTIEPTKELVSQELLIFK